MAVWETYSLLLFIVKNTENSIRRNIFPPFLLSHLSNIATGQTDYRNVDKKNLLGITNRILVKSNLEHAFIDPVALTETYLQDVCEIVYKDFPDRLLGKGFSPQNVEQKESQIKLLQLIIKSKDRNEMIDKLIEEKIRGIFYGNPVEFYTKDKANIGLGNYFKENHHNTIERLSEIIARRNIYVHNNGRVDSKYLREVPKTTFKFGEKIKIEESYIRENIIILRGFAATVSKLVINNAYGIQSSNKQINANYSSFEKLFNS